MKSLIVHISEKCLILTLLFSITTMSAQDVVYITTWNNGSCIDVIFVQNRTQADVVVNLVDRAQLRTYNNAWSFTNSRSNATLILREVNSTNGNRNAIKVYLNRSTNKFVSHLHRQRYTKYLSCN